jgi:hypothetical protein
MLSNDVLAVVGSVRDRTREHVSVALPDLDALTIALAAGSVDAQELIEYMHEGGVRTDAMANVSNLALTDYDFGTLYGRSSTADPLAVHTRILEHETCVEARELRTQLEDALVTTLNEDAQGKLWRQSPTTRIAASVALFRTTDAQACLSAVVGGMVSTDARRVDDLKTRIEDSGVDVMVVSQALRALAATVVGS